MEKIDLLLVNPGNRLEQYQSLNELATVAQPLGIAMLAAFVREQGFRVAIVDAEAEFWTPEQAVDFIVSNFDPAVVGLSAFTTKMTAAGKILRLVKERMPQVITVAGGHHPSSVPALTLDEEAVDYVIKGEGFYPTTELLLRLKEKRDPAGIVGIWCKRNGVIVKGGQSIGIKNLDDLPMAAWDLLPMEKYRAHHWQGWDFNLNQSGFAVIFTSLGCPFDCDYCSVHLVYENRLVRYRNAIKVVDELEMLLKTYGVRNVEIIDDTFTVNYRHVESICDEIAKRGLNGVFNMWCFARTDRSDPTFMKKMKQAGINWVFMGFESGNDTVLQGVNKKQTLAQIEQAALNVWSTGIHIGGNFVFGLPEDTTETMEQTLALAFRILPEYANFFPMMAYPGTRLYEVAKTKGFPLPEKWSQYGFFAKDALPLRNEELSADDIIRFRDTAFTTYFGSKKYQNMIVEKFGPTVLEFLKAEILSKTISRGKTA